MTGCASYNTLQYTASHCNTLHHTATHCITLQYTASHCHTLHHTAIHCITMQYTASHCNTLHHTAIHCNTLQHQRSVDDLLIDDWFSILQRFAAPSAAVADAMHQVLSRTALDKGNYIGLHWRRGDRGHPEMGEQVYFFIIFAYTARGPRAPQNGVSRRNFFQYGQISDRRNISIV